MSDTRLLREYIRLTLNEDDFGGFDVGDMASPWGMSFGSQEDLFNVFVRPFTDVAKTASAEIQKSSRRLAPIFEALMTTIFPFLSSDYKQVFEKQDAAIKNIKAKYKDVYDSTWSAFKDHDVLMTAFLYSPSSTITSAIVRNAPVATVSLLNILAGNRLKGFLGKVKEKFSLGDIRKPLSGDTGPGIPEGIIREAGKDNKNADTNKLVKVLTQPGVKKAVAESQTTKAIETTTQKVVGATLAALVKKAHDLDGVTSLVALQNMLGKKIPGVEKLEQLPQDQRVQLEKQLIGKLQGATKSFFKKNLQSVVKKAMSGGIPANHPFVQAYQKTIASIG